MNNSNLHLQISNVSMPKPKDNSLIAFSIDSPRIGNEINRECRFSGWVLGKSSPAVAIEVVGENDSVLEKIPIRQSRPDVAKIHPNIPGSDKSGFTKLLKIDDITPNTNLFLRAILENGYHASLGTIQIKSPLEQKPLGEERYETRLAIARQYISGSGIEIGALHSPLTIPQSAKVQYVDRMSVEDLRKQYPELKTKDLVEVDIIDNGETLDNVGDSTQDFVIANHFIEHCQNPISAIENMLRVLKIGGILYLAVPDKRFTFDKPRPTTSIQHLLKDYQEGPMWSRRQHFEEWVKYVSKVRDSSQVNARVDQLMKIDYSIHYHVWTQTQILELLYHLRSSLNFPFEVKLFNQNTNEIVVVAEKITVNT